MRIKVKKRITAERKSLAVDPKTHEYLQNLAGELGISQKQCLAMIIEQKKHRDRLDSKRKAEEFAELDIQTAMNQINKRLDRIEKRENPRDTIVSFFKTQEREIIVPRELSIDRMSGTIEEILDATKSIQ